MSHYVYLTKRRPWEKRFCMRKIQCVWLSRSHVWPVEQTMLLRRNALNLQACTANSVNVVLLQLKKNNYATAADSATVTPATRNKTTVQLEPWLSEALASSSLTYKSHPGRVVLPSVSLPQRLLEAASVILESKFSLVFQSCILLCQGTCNDT